MDTITKPKYIEEDILKYLEQQEAYFLYDEDAAMHRATPTAAPEPAAIKISLSAEEQAKQILDAILEKSELQARINEIYENKIRDHNQYELFNLEKIIPNFYIDDAMYENLTFRETLLISYCDPLTHNAVPDPVGGLCLDIQKAQGDKPFKRLKPDLEEQMIQDIARKIQADIDAANDECSGNNASTSKRSSKRAIKQGTVTISDDTPISSQDKKVNKFELNISESHPELIKYKEYLKSQMELQNSKFLVHLSSQLNYDGRNGGSRTTAWVDRNMHTLEEKRREYLINNENLDEKTLYVALQRKSYYIRHTCSMDNINDRKYYSLTKAKDLICEGSNFLLMRYLAITRYTGQFELSTVYINGDMCRNIYNCKGPESGIVNDQRLDLCKIYRVIIEECGIKHKCCTILTLNGQIVKQEWKYCGHVLQLNPCAVISLNKPLGNEHLLLSKTWEKDMQMFSQFLDQKNMNLLKLKSYLLDHPELKDLLADYVQLILLMKPENILDFSIKYFQQFVIDNLPRNEYFEEIEEEEPYRIVM